jgi:S-ribosylhomocysteine lyase LuxS involved in autoinducer biosynthesis
MISIDLFDNGTIDNDTIIVFDNKKLLVNKKRLSYKAIHLEFNFTENIREHEVIIVAHNMGTVPPNTALLLVKDGKNRQEYFITSTNKINAKLLIVYEPPILD